MAGTTGNLAWAEDGSELATEPVDGFKASGYSFKHVPTYENLNWTLQQLGRASVRRFNTAEGLIQARRSGTGGGAPNELHEDFGLVLPPTTDPLWSELWAVAGDATETEFVSDGEFLWTMAGAALNMAVRKRSRIDGSVVATGVMAWDYPYIATAGGNVYALDDVVGVATLHAVDRDTLASSYNVAIGAVTPTAIATDGTYVCVLEGNNAHLYQDTGAALVAVGGAWPYTPGVAVNAVAMDGGYIVLGGATDGGNNEAWILDYAATVQASLTRTGNAAITRIAFDGRRIGFGGAVDAGNYIGLFSGLFGTLRWEDNVAANDVAITLDGTLLRASNGSVAIYDPQDAAIWRIILWDAGAATAVNRLAYDFDGLFALGAPDAGGNRLKRYQIHATPKFYSVEQDATHPHRAIHSIIQPVDHRAL